MLPANLLQREWPPGFSGTTDLGGGFLQVFRQIVHIDEFIYRSKAGAGNHIFEFANVAGPGMLIQDGLDPPCKTFNLFTEGLIIFFKKELNEQRNIVEAFREVRHADLNRAEAIE